MPEFKIQTDLSAQDTSIFSINESGPVSILLILNNRVVEQLFQNRRSEVRTNPGALWGLK